MPIVHPQCYRKGDLCFHWSQDRVDMAANLAYGTCVNNRYHHGNPWNHITEADRVELAKTRPLPVAAPWGGRPRTVITVIPSDRINAHMDDLIWSDCSMVFARDATGAVVTVFYSLPADEHLRDWAGPESQKRNALTDRDWELDLAQHEICLKVARGEHYVKKVGADYVAVEVHV